MDNVIFKDIISKLERYCDYQERCSFDVISKLKNIDAPEVIFDDVIQYLEEHEYIDNLRYAKIFTSSKFSNKRWGKKKIYAALRAKRIDSKDINIALAKIDENEYYNALVYICETKLRNIGDIKTNVNKKKLLNFALQRGFESTLIWQFIKENTKN